MQYEDVGANALPSPEEIAEICAEIRAGLSDRELEKRFGGPKRVDVDVSIHAIETPNRKPRGSQIPTGD